MYTICYMLICFCFEDRILVLILGAIAYILVFELRLGEKQSLYIMSSRVDVLCLIL